MSFLSQAYLPADTSLFHLLSLSELDHGQHRLQQAPESQPSRELPSCARRAQRPRTFTPRFDVTETAEAYELYGEVPGLQPQALDVRFSDAQTLVVTGRTERQQPPAAAGPAPAQAAREADAGTEKVVDEAASSPKSLAATVEDDDYDEADTPLATPDTAASSFASATAAAPSPSAAEKGKQPERPRARYWVAERQVGAFARSFAFAQRVEQDFVTASLRDGVLAVVVPKSLKSRRVAVSVL